MEWSDLILGATVCSLVLIWTLKGHGWRGVLQVPAAPIFCDGTGRPRGTHHAHHHAMQTGQWSPDHRGSLIDGLAAFVERDLRLTAGQQAAWRRLTRDAKAAMAEAGPLPGAPETRSADALLQLAEMRQLFATGLTALDRIEPAFRDFYALLDGTQQSRVDAALRHGRPL